MAPSQLTIFAQSVHAMPSLLIICLAGHFTNDFIQNQNWNRNNALLAIHFCKQITTKFCTCHHSYAVVTCAKFCSDYFSMICNTPKCYFHLNRIRRENIAWNGPSYSCATLQPPKAYCHNRCWRPGHNQPDEMVRITRSTPYWWKSS